MELSEYKVLAYRTAVYKEKVIYPCHEIVEEAGEVNGHVKRILRDDNGVLTDDRKRHITLELGDVMWGLVALARDLNVELPDYISCAPHPTDRNVQGIRCLSLSRMCAVLSILCYGDTELHRKEIRETLTDCIYAVGSIASAFGIEFSDVLEMNIRKLENRAKNGTIKGSGDDR